MGEEGSCSAVGKKAGYGSLVLNSLCVGNWGRMPMLLVVLL